MADESDTDKTPELSSSNNSLAEEDMMYEPRTVNNSLNDNLRNIINNVEALEDAICMVGQFVEEELSFSASFLVTVKNMIGDENPLVNLLQPSVDTRLPAILIQLYFVCQEIVHIRWQLQSYPEMAESQPTPSAVTVDFSRCRDSSPNVDVHDNIEDGHGVDTVAPDRHID